MAYKNLYLDIVTSTGTHRTMHAGIIAGNIEKKFPGLRQEPDYKALEDRFFDYTQACNKEEQRGWMGHYMNEALKMEQKARRLQTLGPEHWNTAAGLIYEAAIQFLVAYDMILD